jgi:hypothetical protein
VNQYEMIVLIVIAAILARIVRERMRLRAVAPPAVPPETDALIAEVARLRDRVEVLERIATDPTRRLGEEIENLRSRDHAAL